MRGAKYHEDFQMPNVVEIVYSTTCEVSRTKYRVHVQFCAEAINRTGGEDFCSCL
jgi:hypothetical protein